MEEVPKLRTPRDVGQKCSCPPGKSRLLVPLFQNILDHHASTGQCDQSLARRDIYLAGRIVSNEVCRNLRLYTVSQKN